MAAMLACGLIQAQDPNGIARESQGSVHGTNYPQGSREPVVIASDVKEIEEGSLPMDLQTSEVTRRANGEWIRRHTYVEMRQAQDLGLRIFAFTLSPKERIAFHLTSSEGDRLWMGFLKPNTAGPQKAGIQALEQKQKKMKLPRLEFENTSSEAFTLYVKVMGPTRAAYKIRIDRKQNP